MNRRVLFVDDDEKILSSFRRILADTFELETALGPKEALNLAAGRRTFAAVVSDLRMPDMDGVALLEKIRQTRPDTVRVMLTGYADLDAAMNAVNRGQVFRFLSKPCDPDTLRATVEAAVEQHRLITAERVLLERTLKGCVEVMSETLSLVNPAAFARSTRVQRFVRVICQQFNPPGQWGFEIAAMLSQLGAVMLSEEAAAKVAKGQKLTEEERQLSEMVPEIGRGLLARIPRLGGVAKMIAYQAKNFDGTGIPRDDVEGEDIPLGARLLRLALDFDSEVARRKSWGAAFLELEKVSERYDPQLLYYLEGALGVEARYTKAAVAVSDLCLGMVLNQDVKS
ncbi:MAG: HD domain-containing phosphohydrolase, partial [Desulfovibrionaceae bacterium]